MHRASIKHHGADALMRLPTDREDKIDLDKALPVLKIVLASKVKFEEENDENTT